MSTAPKAAAFAVLLRITFSGFASMSHRWSVMLWIIAALSMTIGNLGALMQRDVKRMLAYSSIAHAGYLLAAFTALPHQGIAAACFYTASYAAMNVGAFIVVTEAAGYDESIRTVEDYQGLALRHPMLAGLLAFFLLSLIGIPFTGGFFGKFYVFAGTLQAGHVWLAVIGLINSGVACYYYLRLLASVYTRRENTELDIGAVRNSTRVPAGIALALTAAATLMLGIMPGRVLHLADYASWMLQPNQPTAGASTTTATIPAISRQ
jgi:NADH-quinone oxidoreductase subunit N